MKDCDKCLYKRCLSLLEIELNAVGRHIFGYVQWSMKSRSRSANNTSIAEIMS